MWPTCALLGQVAASRASRLVWRCGSAVAVSRAQTFFNLRLNLTLALRRLFIVLWQTNLALSTTVVKIVHISANERHGVQAEEDNGCNQEWGGFRERRVGDRRVHSD